MSQTFRELKNVAEVRAKRSIRSLLASPVIYPALRRRAMRNDPVTILAYHTLGAGNEDFDAWTVLPVGEFRKQVEFLMRSYEIISLDAAFDGRQRASAKPRVILTFDDGDVGLHTHMLGVVRQLEVPATIYVATRQIEAQQPFWFDQIMNALQTQEPVTVDLDEVGLGRWTVGQCRGAGNWCAISGILEALKTLTPPDRADACDRILRQVRNLPRIQFTPLAPLGIHQLRELADCPWITIAAHSHCHNLLDQIPIEQARDSIDTSRRLLEEWAGRPVRHFAYPNGNHTFALAHAVEQLGFRSAAALGMALWDGRGDVYSLPRVAIGRYDDLNRFKLRLAGV